VAAVGDVLAFYPAVTNAYNLTSAGIIGSKYVGGKMTMIQYISDQPCLTSLKLLENAYIFDYEESLSFQKSEILDFFFIGEDNLLGFLGGSGMDILDPREQADPDFFEVYDSTFEAPHRIEEEAGNIFYFYSQDVRVVDVKTRKTFECRNIYEGTGFLPERAFIFQSKYISVLEDNYTLSIFDFRKCDVRLGEIPLEVPDSTDSDNSGITPFSISYGNGNELRILSGNEDVKYLMTWNLNGIIVGDKFQRTIPGKVYDLPPQFREYVFSLNTKDMFLSAVDENEAPVVLAIEGNELKWLVLDVKPHDNIELEKRFTSLTFFKKTFEPDEKDRYIPRFSHLGTFVSCIDDKGILRVWKTSTGTKILALDLKKFGPVTISFSKDEKSIGVICMDGKVRFYPTSVEDFYEMGEMMLGTRY
jgi:WD40 repeat protein